MRTTMWCVHLMIPAILMTITGCGSTSDERLVSLAEKSSSEQARQNERMAEQSTQVAEASKHLVEADSQARRELIRANSSMQADIEFARANLDSQRDLLESERCEIAQQRQRDPVIAEAIGAVGLTLACLLPLLLAGYIIRCLRQNLDSDEALSELLVMELASDQPSFLSSTQLARIEHQSGDDDSSTPDDEASSQDAEQPPF